MENKDKSYFQGIADGMKTLVTGLKITLKEYFTPKSTEQYPENRKTTLHVSKRHRGRLVFKRVTEQDLADSKIQARGLQLGDYKCTACTMCEKSCPNDTIKITSHMEENPETGRKKKVLDDYQYDLGDCMFCQLCVNACNFDAIEFTNDFENAVFDRSKLVLHLDKEVYKGGSLPNLIDGGAPLEIGKFNTKTK
jgi:NADH-quinone oxidoreductase subunit I